MKNILLIEDDEYKAADISKILAELYPKSPPERATSVTSALRAISFDQYWIIVLDMSLPTFELKGAGGGGSPQGQGGLEVLRLAGKLKSSAQFIVVTQYPDIEVDGREVGLKTAARVLRNRFELNVEHCILYEFDADTWRAPLRDALRSISDHGEVS